MGFPVVPFGQLRARRAAATAGADDGRKLRGRRFLAMDARQPGVAATKGTSMLALRLETRLTHEHGD